MSKTPANGDGQATTAPAAPDADLSEGLPSETHLSTIRDLLFGREMTEVDRRFARLEARLAEEHAALREALTARIDALESYVRDELASLNEGLGQERRTRSEAIDRVRQDSRTAEEALSRRVTEMQQSSESGGETVRRRIHEETTRAQEALRSTADDLMRRLDDRTALLDDRKADRKALAALFADAAARLEDGI